MDKLADNSTVHVRRCVCLPSGEYVLRMPPAGAADAAPTVPSSVENLNATGDPLMAVPIPTTIADLVTTDQPATTPTAQVPRLNQCGRLMAKTAQGDYPT